MSRSPSNFYLETQVLTATPQKLRLMLIEGAIRKARNTLACWEEEQYEAAFESLVRCREIVSELLGGNQDDSIPVARQMAAIYLFLFRTLIEAQFERSAEKVASVLRVLEVEQETWRQLCEQMPEPPDTDATVEQRTKEVSANGLGAIPSVPARRMHGSAPHVPSTAARFSIEG